MQILVIGGNGFIGRYLARRLGGVAGHEVFCTFRSRTPGDDTNHWYRLELTDPVGLEKLFGHIRPEVVVHLAALADVGTAEREPERAAAVNAIATAAIARHCEAYGARLVFVSTEYVFDGQRGFYREGEPPNPTTQYGRTKRDGERAVASLSSCGSILRTSIVYGWPAPGGRNFVPRLINRLEKDETYAGATQVMRTPVYVEHLVDGIIKLVDEFHPGIHHMAGRDWVSMYDFALAVARKFGLDDGLVTASDELPGSPDRLGLDCAATMERLDLEHPGLAEGLAAMRASGGNNHQPTHPLYVV